MAKWKNVCKKLLFPPAGVVGLVSLLAVAGLCYVFLGGHDAQPIAYGIYAVSFYALCLLAASAPPVIRKSKALLLGNRHTHRYLTEKELRARISLCTGTLLNLAYAALKLATGITMRSTWFGALALYYLISSLIHYVLIRNDRAGSQIPDQTERRLRSWKSCRTCGWLLCVLNLSMTGMAFQMIRQNKCYSYPGYVIYASAAYTFYRITKSIINVTKIKKTDDPVLSAAYTVDFCMALMSVFALQTAMFSSFGADMSPATQQLMNSLTGSAVCLLVLCAAIFMVVYPRREIRVLGLWKDQSCQEESPYGAKSKHL